MPGAVAETGIAVTGLRELQQAFAAAGKEANVIMRDGLRQVAEPIRAAAESLALSEITHMTIPWSKMRVGVTRKLVYVAPKRHGVKSPFDPKNRPKFGIKMAEEVMGPALARNQGRLQGDLEVLFDKLADEFNRR